MVIVDMLTKFIQNFLNKNIGEVEDKNLLLILPNKKRIELGNHQASIEITFHSWLGIWIIFRRGALGLTEGYIHNYWETKDLIELMDYCIDDLGRKALLLEKFQFQDPKNYLFLLFEAAKH